MWQQFRSTTNPLSVWPSGKAGGGGGGERGRQGLIPTFLNPTPVYPSVFARISVEIGRQYGSTSVFLKIRTKSFQKVWKSQVE